MMHDQGWIVGVDEAGRGPLAGSVIAAAVILNPNVPIDGLRDSKKITAKRREELFQQIRQYSIAWAIGRASVREIDELNILQASLLAMKRAVMNLKQVPARILIDGTHAPKLPYPCECIIGGDDVFPEISAASIVAKVVRDRLMLRLHDQYPQYGFAQHKGYGTKLHLEGLKKWGASPAHRRSFAPVRECLN